MNHKAIIIAACVIVVAGIVFVLASTSGRGGATTQDSVWTVRFPMPPSNTTAAHETGTSPQTK